MLRSRVNKACCAVVPPALSQSRCAALRPSHAHTRTQRHTPDVCQARPLHRLFLRIGCTRPTGKQAVCPTLWGPTLMAYHRASGLLPGATSHTHGCTGSLQTGVFTPRCPSVLQAHTQLLAYTQPSSHMSRPCTRPTSTRHDASGLYRRHIAESLTVKALYPTRGTPC